MGLEMLPSGPSSPAAIKREVFLGGDKKEAEEDLLLRYADEEAKHQ